MDSAEMMDNVAESISHTHGATRRVKAKHSYPGREMVEVAGIGTQPKYSQPAKRAAALANPALAPPPKKRSPEEHEVPAVAPRWVPTQVLPEAPAAAAIGPEVEMAEVAGDGTQPVADSGTETASPVEQSEEMLLQRPVVAAESGVEITWLRPVGSDEDSDRPVVAKIPAPRPRSPPASIRRRSRSQPRGAPQLREPGSSSGIVREHQTRETYMPRETYVPPQQPPEIVVRVVGGDTRTRRQERSERTCISCDGDYDQHQSWPCYECRYYVCPMCKFDLRMFRFVSYGTNTEPDPAEWICGRCCDGRITQGPE